jgi:hypothetical protein
VTIAAVAIAAIGSVAIGAGDSDDSAHLTTVHNANDRRRLFFDDCLFSSASPNYVLFDGELGGLLSWMESRDFWSLRRGGCLTLCGRSWNGTVTGAAPQV